MIRPSEIRSARTFIRHIQKQNSFFRVILELLEVLGLLRCAALDFKELDLVRSEGLRNFLHEVRELYEDENTLMVENPFPANLSVKWDASSKEPMLTL